MQQFQCYLCPNIVWFDTPRVSKKKPIVHATQRFYLMYTTKLATLTDETTNRVGNAPGAPQYFNSSGGLSRPIQSHAYMGVLQGVLHCVCSMRPPSEDIIWKLHS